MPLYTRDENIDAMVEEILRVTEAETKTEAVLAALVCYIREVSPDMPLLAQVSIEEQEIIQENVDRLTAVLRDKIAADMKAVGLEK